MLDQYHQDQITQSFVSVSNGFSWAAQHLQEDTSIVSEELTRPSIIFRPKVFQDGNKFCCLYGDDLMQGIAAFGDSPDEACREFDRIWIKKQEGKDAER